MDDGLYWGASGSVMRSDRSPLPGKVSFSANRGYDHAVMRARHREPWRKARYSVFDHRGAPLSSDSRHGIDAEPARRGRPGARLDCASGGSRVTRDGVLYKAARCAANRVRHDPPTFAHQRDSANRPVPRRSGPQKSGCR